MSSGRPLRRWTSTAHRHRTLAAFVVPGYLGLWLSNAAWSLSTTVTVIAIGWVTLQVSDSSLAVGGVLAARLIPALLLGIPLGGLIDRLDRRRILVRVSFVVAALLILAGLGASASSGLPALLVLSLVLGVTDTLHGTATQAYAVDLVGRDGATNALALANLGGFLLGILGSVVGGLVLDASGTSGAFVFAGVVSGVAAAFLWRGPPALAVDPNARRSTPAFREALTLVFRNRTVALIALLVIVAEILGFSCTALFPTFARDILRSDAAGLGLLVAARYAGSIAVLLALARASAHMNAGRVAIIATVGMGLALVGFAVSRSFALSIAMLFGVGVASAGIDTSVQSGLQKSVEESERGAAVGVWYFAIGFGPVGQLSLGAAAVAIGAPAALALSGGLLAAIGLAILVLNRARFGPAEVSLSKP